MTHSDVTISCITCGLCGVHQRQASVDNQISDQLLYDLQSCDVLDQPGTLASQKDRSNCVSACPWPIESAVYHCPGPGQVRIDVVCKSEHRSNPGARWSECRVDKYGIAIFRQQRLHVRHCIPDFQSTNGCEPLFDNLPLAHFIDITRHDAGPLSVRILQRFENRWPVRTN